jgi:hypothetical protein
MGYLIEATRRKNEISEENRLSEVFSASFNNSKMFQKLFLSFIGHPFTNNLRSLTQKNFKVGDRNVYIDVCIIDAKGKTVIIIENKIGSSLEQRQLKTYNKVDQLNHAKKIALVKHYFEPLPNGLGWRVCHWTDLHEFYLDAIEKVEKKNTD